MKRTSDSPTAHSAPHVPPRPTNKDRKWATPDRAEKPLIADTVHAKQAHAYLDAILTREGATPLSEYARSLRALERNPDTIYQHAEIQNRLIDETAQHANRLGKLNPQWASFDPSLPRLIKQSARDADKVSRFDTRPTDRLPLRPVQKPLEKSRQTFYLKRGTELSDTTGADTIRAAPARIGEPEQWEGVTTLLTLCAFAASEGVRGLADAIVRLRPSSDVLDTVYKDLGHSKRRKLSKEIPLAETRHAALLARLKAE